MNFRQVILQTLLFLANVALVFLIAWALGFNAMAAAGGKRIYNYLVVAFGLFVPENFIFKKLRGNS